MELSKSSNLATNLFNNSVELVGEVVGAPVYSHKFDDIEYYSVRLSVKRSPKSHKYDNIHLFISSDNLIINSVVIDLGVRLAVTGYLVQSKLHGINDLSVVSTKVSVSDETSKDINIVYLKGNIYKLFDLKNINNSTKVVRSFIMHHSDNLCNNKERNLSALVNCWNNTAKLLDSQFVTNDDVVVRGQLEGRDIISRDDNTSVVLHQISALTLYKVDTTDNN